MRQRLYNISKTRKEEFEYVLTRYALERFLYRLGRSVHQKRFVLKGAMLFQAWSPEIHRMTRDLDLLDSNNHEAQKVVHAIREVLNSKVPDDGLVFNGKSIKWGAIRQGQAYHGVRLHFKAKLTPAVIPLQVDVGFGDAIVPKPKRIRYPTLLGFPSPHVLAYAKETVVAEKLHAIVLLGMTNSRLKDYFDLSVLLKGETLDADMLAQAIKATFKRRSMPVPAELPIGLTDEFSHDPSQQALWRAFVKRNGLDLEPLAAVVERLRTALGPALSRAGL